MIEVFVAGVGLLGPGMANWPSALPVLTGQQDPSWELPPLPPPSLLAANERRRTGTVVRVALAVAVEASAMAGTPPGTIRSVFASSNGDGAVIHPILEALAGPHSQVSPTQFHNSVHNAAAGYWSIGTRSRAPTSSLGCHDASAAMGLLNAAAEAQVEQEPVLLCLYDAPLPEPLAQVRRTTCVFGAALVLMPEPSMGSLARLCLDWQPGPVADARSLPRGRQLQTLYEANPAARILPVLQAIAQRESRALSFPVLEDWLMIDVTT
jgi:hypothetical protein